MKKKQLNKSEIKELNQRLENYNFEIDKKDRVEYIEKEKIRIICINQVPAFFYLDEKLIPTLKFLEKMPLKKVTVDMGAIRFVCSGADIMRPGIVSFDNDIVQDEIIQIVDETHGKSLAIGISRLSSVDLVNTDKGKVVKNLHFVGDDIWNFP